MLTGGGIQRMGSIHKWQHPQMAKKRKQEEGHLAQYAVREVQAGDGSTEGLCDVLPASRQKHKEKEKLQEQQKWGEERQQEEGASASFAEGDMQQAPEQGALGVGRCDPELLRRVPVRFGYASAMHTHAETHSARVIHTRDPQCIPQFCKNLHVHEMIWDTKYPAEMLAKAIQDNLRNEGM